MTIPHPLPAPAPAATAARSPLGVAAAAVGAALVALLAVAVVALLHRMDATDVGGGLGVAAVAGALVVVVGLAALGRAHRDRGVAVAAVGVVVVLAGSGVGRWSEVEHTGRYGGAIVARSDRWWPVVLLGVVVLVAGVVLAVRRRSAGRGAVALSGLAAQAVGLVVLAATMGDVVVGQWIEGRPQRRHGRLVPVPASTGATVGSLWSRAAADEAAAVGAFTDLAVRLERVGAPASLVARSRDAAADEVRHARQCRALARRHGAHGEPTMPAPRPSPRSAPRSVELVRLAVESYVDGVVGEGMAAARLEQGATSAPTSAPTLRAIARDERAHAVLGGDIVRWCVGQRPRLVPLAVRAAAGRLPVSTSLPEEHAAHPDAALRAAGLVDRRSSVEVWAEQRRSALAAVEELVAPAGRQARGRGPAQ